MSKISRMSYVNLGRMIDSAVGAGIMDRSSGRSHLPDPFLFKMQALAEQFREQRTRYAKLTGEAQDIRGEREKVSPMLAQLIRNIHTTFTRFHKLGKVSPVDMKEYQIPRVASQHPANRLKTWIHFGSTITRIFNKQKEEGRTTLPPYVLTEATVEILAQHLTKAVAVQFKLERRIMANQGEHQKLLHLRRQVVDTLELVRRHLELSLYGKARSTRRLAMAAYGMLLPDGKGQSHMLSADMNPSPPEQTIQRQKAQDPEPPPKAKQPPPPETAETAAPEPKPNLDQLPEDFLEAITVQEKPTPAKATQQKSPAAREKEKKKARRKQARRSRKQSR